MAAERKVTVFASAQAVLDKQVTKNEHLTDLWEGLKWRLARDPLADTYRIQNSEPPTYVARSPKRSGAALVAVFRFDAFNLHICDLRVDVTKDD